MQENDVPVYVTVTAATRGGLLVQYHHLEGFIPASHLGQVCRLAKIDIALLTLELFSTQWWPALLVAWRESASGLLMHIYAPPITLMMLSCPQGADTMYGKLMVAIAHATV